MRIRASKFTGVFAMMLCGIVLCCEGFAQATKVDAGVRRTVDWPEYGGVMSQHFSPLRTINAGNVRLLKVKWQFDMHEAGSGLEASPIVIGTGMYVCTPLERVVKLDAVSGA